MITIRKLLASVHFDWTRSTVLVPSLTTGSPIPITQTQPVLDVEFNLEYKAKEACPAFLAEDEHYLYFLFNKVEIGKASFHQVPKDLLDVVPIEGLSGRLPTAELNLGFTPPIEALLSSGANPSPCFVGWDEGFVFGIFDTVSEAKEWLTYKVLTSYAMCLTDNELDGYHAYLKKVFAGRVTELPTRMDVEVVEQI